MSSVEGNLAIEPVNYKRSYKAYKGISLTATIVGFCLSLSWFPVYAGDVSEAQGSAAQLRAAHLKSVGGRANRSFYESDRWDLSDIPNYRPEQRVSGDIRITGKYLTTGRVLRQWQEGFKKYHPNANVIAADLSEDLVTGGVDIIQQRGMTWGELFKFQAKHGYYPLEIEMATGSYNVPGWSPAMAIFVNEKNPIKEMTIEQLDGVFGGQRRGGWIGTVWNANAARGAEDNIRQWGGLGLNGQWKNEDIIPNGRPLKYHIQLYFEKKVFNGGSIWNDNLREYAHVLRPDGTRSLSSVQIVQATADNKYGISYADLGSDMPGVKTIPIASRNGGPAKKLTLDNLRDHSYPLYLEVYLYANQKPDEEMQPKVKEFLRYVLSREGQQAVQNDGKWLPLNGDMVNKQSEKIN